MSTKISTTQIAQEVPANTPAVATDYWLIGTAAIESKLNEALRADPNDAPFGMDPENAKIWHATRAQAYQHALEMMGIPQAR